jgi:steroid 5-alpha reductase family enzyme
MLHFIAIAQPLLLFFLSVPLHAALTLPPTELSPGPIPFLSIPFSLIPSSHQSIPSATPSTPVLNLNDLILTFFALLCIYTEYTSDNAMYAYQTAKHAAPTQNHTKPPPMESTIFNKDKVPKPASYPMEFHPGFKTGGLWKWSRHPNFAAEQLFWVIQACFVAGGSRVSAVTKAGWVGGGVFGPCFAVSGRDSSVWVKSISL